MSAELSEIVMVHPPEEGQEPADDGSVRTAEQAPEVARGFLLVAAPDGGSAGNAVLLVVSELVSNAVLHAGGVTGFRLEAGSGTVAVVVQDASTAPPKPRPWDAGEPGGLGWHLVQDLSDDVQVRIHAAGKTVTAIVPCPTSVLPQVW
ncbi:ATP-binding protein [Streptomyces coeruleorubidus]|uniref:ATP-binding protein n=1 Tax=Streptomyces coeruleorubidus TaxID=116188 RepID=UPI0033EA78BF